MAVMVVVPRHLGPTRIVQVSPMMRIGAREMGTTSPGTAFDLTLTAWPVKMINRGLRLTPHRGVHKPVQTTLEVGVMR